MADQARQTIRLPFPTGGVVERYAYQDQPARTTPYAVNVWPYDTIEGRERGGSRPGLTKATGASAGGAFQFLISGAFLQNDDTISQFLVGACRGQLFRAVGDNNLVPLPDNELGSALNTNATHLVAAQMGNDIFIANKRDYPLIGTGTMGTTGILTSPAVTDWTDLAITPGIDQAFIWGIDPTTTKTYSISGVTTGSLTIQGYSGPPAITLTGKCTVTRTNTLPTYWCKLKLTGAAWPSWYAYAGTTLTVGGTVIINAAMGNKWIRDNEQTLSAGKPDIATATPVFPTVATSAAYTLTFPTVSIPAEIDTDVACTMTSQTQWDSWGVYPDPGTSVIGTVGGMTLWSYNSGVGYWSRPQPSVLTALKSIAEALPAMPTAATSAAYTLSNTWAPAVSPTVTSQYYFTVALPVAYPSWFIGSDGGAIVAGSGPWFYGSDCTAVNSTTFKVITDVAPTMPTGSQTFKVAWSGTGVCTQPGGLGNWCIQFSSPPPSWILNSGVTVSVGNYTGSPVNKFSFLSNTIISSLTYFGVALNESATFTAEWASEGGGLTATISKTFVDRINFAEPYPLWILGSNCTFNANGTTLQGNQWEIVNQYVIKSSVSDSPDGQIPFSATRVTTGTCAITYRYTCSIAAIWPSWYADSDVTAAVDSTTLYSPTYASLWTKTDNTLVAEKTSLAVNPTFPSHVGTYTMTFNRLTASGNCAVTQGYSGTTEYKCVIERADDGADWPNWSEANGVQLTVDSVMVANGTIGNLWTWKGGPTLEAAKDSLEDDPPFPDEGTDLAYELIAPFAEYACNWRVIRPVVVFSPALQDDIACAPLIATTGIVPVESPLVCVYRDRLVLAGPDNTWFMSRVNDPTDWNYGADPNDSSRAIAGTNYRGGQVAQPITALIPYGDDYLIFACKSQIWIMRGDPGYDAQIYCISRNVGVLGSSCWCPTPEGDVVILAAGGLFVIPASGESVPVPFSKERLPRELINVNMETCFVSMEFDTRFNGMHVWVTPMNGDAPTGFWIDWATKGFWPMSVPGGMAPSTMVVHRWRAPDPEETFIAGTDGFLRKFDFSATDDDGIALTSEVSVGPIPLGASGGEGLIASIAGDMATSSTYSQAGRNGATRYAGNGFLIRYHPSNPDPLSPGDVDFEMGGWFLFNDLSPTNLWLMARTNSTDGDQYFFYHAAGLGISFGVSYDGTPSHTTTVIAAEGALDEGKWYFIRAWHDATNNQIGVQINNGTPTTAAHTTGVYALGTAPFYCGGPGVTKAVVDSVYFKTGIYTQEQAGWLYNEGMGRCYADLPLTMQDGLAAWWDMGEESGTRYDAHGDNHLTVIGPTYISRVQKGIARVNENLTMTATGGTWTVIAEQTPEATATGTSKYSGVWVPGTNRIVHPRVRGVAGLVKLRSAGRWGLENIIVDVMSQGRKR